MLLKKYYKKIIKNDLMYKMPQKSGKVEIKKVVIESVFIINKKWNNIIEPSYIYNISILIRLLNNKFYYLKKIIKKYSENKIHFKLNIKKEHMYNMIEVLNIILLPILDSFNMSLNEKKFDIFGSINYKIEYVDPIFTSKNAVVVWTPQHKLNLKISFTLKNKRINILILNYLKIGIKKYDRKNKKHSI